VTNRIAGVTVLSRQTFLDEYWAYRAGQHVTILGKTNSGKTTLGYQLLDKSARPELPALVLVMKPRDATASHYARGQDMPRVRYWPQAPNPMRRKPRGYTIWPQPTFDPDRDDETLFWTFRSVILDSYKRGNRILFADEIVDVSELRSQIEPKLGNLRRPLDAVWKRGRSMGCGLWAATQRPAGMSYHGYSAPEHIFIAHDPDYRTRKRYDEIGGVDTGLVQSVVMRLPPWHFLYLQRSTGTYCVVAP
jgi:hypothetical protein